MTTYTAEGIILRDRPSAESDKLITILSREKGKVVAVARGLRKPQSKLKGFLELFRHNFFQLAVGKTFDIITNVETLEVFDGFSSDLKKLALASYFAEATDSLVGENEPVGRVFELLLTSLRTLKATPLNFGLLKNFFPFRLGSLLGFQPELYQSVASGKKLTEEDRLLYSAFRGGLLTQEEERSNEKGAFPISHKAVKLLRLFVEKDPEIILKFRIDLPTGREVEKVTREFSELLFERKPKAENFLARISK